MSDKIGADETMVMLPKLTLDQLGWGGDLGFGMLLTVDHVETQQVKGSKERILIFREYPGNSHWLNNTQLRILVKHLGDDPAKWAGKQVPLGPVETEYNGQPFVKLYVKETTEPGWAPPGIASAWK